ncbi:uncharacterized protein LOC131639665 [Vicia villosa]|uniref:uncharacterized protein LOC131639665 n=1 Tax=Vicia villosa TaxID=3911 RepID=UPI00273C4745|nr:uncharacterized protein LOC131639665 [Vicia villosa]
MSTSHSSPSNPDKEKADETRPLWKYVTKIKSFSGNGGGNFEIKCNLCDIVFNGSYTTLRSHLLKISGKGVRSCVKITTAKLIELKKMDNEAKSKEEKSKRKFVSLPPNSSEGQNIVGANPKKERNASTIEGSFNTQARETLDSEITRMFYFAGLPFHLARNPHFRRALSIAANSSIPGYQPPGYNKLRTTLLIKERQHVENLLQPIKNSWNQKGVTIVSDGWSDPQRRPLINFMVVTESGPMFLKAIDCSNGIKDKEFIAKKMREVIMEVGPSNVVQIVTDNATVCKAAGLIIEAEFPSIFWTPCVVHTLNLAFKNICAAKDIERNNDVYKECSWITKIAEDAIFIKKFVMCHSMRLSIFISFNSLKFLSIAPTRFAYTTVMLRRFKLLKRDLHNMVISEQWFSYKKYDVEKAKFVKETLLDDNWWDRVNYIISFTSPIYDVLRRTDTEASCLHLIYEMWDSMIEEVRKAIYKYERKAENEQSTFHEIVHSILISRWTKSSRPLHCLAHSLNPSEDPNRVCPHQDKELTHERGKCFKRLFPDADERRKVNVEFVNFSDGREGFADIDSLNDMGLMDPKTWWLVHGVHAPILQKVALKLLTQLCSSSCSERNWSTYSFIHSLKRNKMAPQRAEDLVFVHSNLRLLSRNSPQYKQEETKMWDIAGDNFGSLDDCRILEVANLSLDEPELENEFSMMVIN